MLIVTDNSTNTSNYYYNLFTPAMILSLLVLFCSCASTKITLEKETYSDTLKLNRIGGNNFHSAYAFLRTDQAIEFATTAPQKKAVTGLNYIIQNQYDSAVATFINTLKQKDTLEQYWMDFTQKYYSYIDYDWKKMKELANNRPDIKTDSSFHFYIDKPEFKIDFLKDSVVIPLEFDIGLPQIVITINGEEFIFLLDTGCDKTLFGKKIIEHLATPICDNFNEIDIETIDGSAKCYNCFLHKFDFGDIKINNFPIWMLEKNEIKVKELLFITTFQCDGVIGWDLLNHFDFTIDYKNEQLILRKPIKRETKNRNLFWYEQPLVLFYTENKFPLIAFFDSGSNLTSFNEFVLDNFLKLDKNELKSSKISTHGVNGWVKNTYYKLPNFNMFTISDSIINKLDASTAMFYNFNNTIINQSVYISGWLGSDWFKDKIVRVDMTNGIFEISE